MRDVSGFLSWAGDMEAVKETVIRYKEMLQEKPEFPSLYGRMLCRTTVVFKNGFLIHRF